MNYFNNLYTLTEIAINHNISKGRLSNLSHFMNEKKIGHIKKNFPELIKFLPYCQWYIIQRKKYISYVCLYL